MMERPAGYSLIVWAMAVLLLWGCKSRDRAAPVGEFLPETDAFWEVVPRGAVAERIGIHFEFTEGPAWHPRGYLVFSDIPSSTVYKWTGKKYVTYLDSSNQANGLVFLPGGDLLACEHATRSISRISAEGRRTEIAGSFEGRRLNSPNDLCRSSRGVIYFTDPPWGLPLGNDDPGKELDFNGVFRVDHGQVSLIDSTLSWPNGIALSPDEHYLYVANVEIDEVDGEEQYDVFWMRYTLNEEGEPVDKEIFFRAPDTTLPGGPDGMTVDRDGNLFITGPGGILVVNPQGAYLGTISLPLIPSNLTFGPRGKRLFITAQSTLYRVTME